MSSEELQLFSEVDSAVDEGSDQGMLEQFVEIDSDFASMPDAQRLREGGERSLDRYGSSFPLASAQSARRWR